MDHVEPLSGGASPAVGSRRLRYLVHDGTVAAARPIAYVVGEFRFNSLSEMSTRVTWRYSFTLTANSFSETLGPLGRSFFRRSFVDRDFAHFMDAAVLDVGAWQPLPRRTPSLGAFIGSASARAWATIRCVVPSFYKLLL